MWVSILKPTKTRLFQTRWFETKSKLGIGQSVWVACQGLILLYRSSLVRGLLSRGTGPCNHAQVCSSGVFHVSSKSSKNRCQTPFHGHPLEVWATTPPEMAAPAAVHGQTRVVAREANPNRPATSGLTPVLAAFLSDASEELLEAIGAQ